MSGNDIELNPDRPILSKKDDKFQRARFAEVLAKQLITSSKDESFVVSLLGPWGSGKTSIINMLEESLAENNEVKILKFNPWFFSNTEDLLTIFFREISNELGLSEDSRLKELGMAMEKYGEMLSPVEFVPLFGSPAGYLMKAIKSLGKFIRWKAEPKVSGILNAKINVEKILKKNSKRFVIIIDDIDRLEAREVKEIMRLVRLVGDFPNVSYVLSYDQEIVKRYLSDENINGHEFLEKIIQVSYHVPILRETELTKFLINELNKVLSTFEDLEMNDEDLTNVFHMGVRGLFKGPRDVRRYINALPVALKTLREEVSAIDIIALEALRILIPDLYIQLADNQKLLTSTKEDYGWGNSNDEKKVNSEKFQKLLSLGGDRKEAVGDLFELIFPSSKRYTSNMNYGHNWLKTWRTNKRVAHPEVLSFYLEKSLPEGVLPAKLVREAFNAMEKKIGFEDIISNLTGAELEHLLDRLIAFEDRFKFDKEAVATAVKIILNHADKLREDRKGFYDFGADISVGSLNLRLIESLKLEDDRRDVVDSILPFITTLSWRWDLIGLIGHVKGLGHKLVAIEYVEKLESELIKQIVSASVSDLIKERDLVFLVQLVEESQNTEKEVFKEKFKDPELFMTFLGKTIATSRSQSMGSVAIKTKEYLPWTRINKLLGNERVSIMVQALVPDPKYSEKQNYALDLAKRHLAGELKEYDPRRNIQENEDEEG